MSAHRGAFFIDLSHKELYKFDPKMTGHLGHSSARLLR